MVPICVKPQKNDAADAEAICEAAARPTMRFVPVKSADGQCILLLHRTRYLLIRRRTGMINALRTPMAEFGVVAPQGRKYIDRLLAVIEDEADDRLTVLARTTLKLLAAQIAAFGAQITAVERELRAPSKTNAASRRLQTLPGIGFVTATVLVAGLADAGVFRSGPPFAAWPGLTPRQNSTGGKERSGRISEIGDRYNRQLSIDGAAAVQTHRPKTFRRSAPGPTSFPNARPGRS